RPPTRSHPFPYTTLFRSLEAATYDELLDAKVNVSQLAAALAKIEGLGANTVSALNILANRTNRPGADAFSLSSLVGLKAAGAMPDRKSTRLNSSHVKISY